MCDSKEISTWPTEHIERFTSRKRFLFGWYVVVIECSEQPERGQIDREVFKTGWGRLKARCLTFFFRTGE